MLGDAAGRIDGEDAFLGNVHFSATHIGGEGDDLAVDIRGRYAVVVNHIDGADTAPGEHLDRISAHTAHTEHRHMAFGQALHGGIAQQHTGTGEQIGHKQ